METEQNVFADMNKTDRKYLEMMLDMYDMQQKIGFIGDTPNGYCKRYHVNTYIGMALRELRYVIYDGYRYTWASVKPDETTVHAVKSYAKKLIKKTPSHSGFVNEHTTTNGVQGKLFTVEPLAGKIDRDVIRRLVNVCKIADKYGVHDDEKRIDFVYEWINR